MPVLISAHLSDGQTLDILADEIAISVDRLGALESGAANPTAREVSQLANALDVDPIHLFRASPSVLAQRANAEPGTALGPILDEIGSFLATYMEDLEPDVVEMPAGSVNGARATGEGWATRNAARGYRPRGADPLVDAVERELNVPVFIWPVPNAPLGATVDFNGVLGIWINSHDRPTSSQRFTLAHEVGHLLLGHATRGSIIIDREGDLERPGSQDEKFAHSCGSGILANRETLEAAWAGDPTPVSVAAVAAEIGASYAATLNLLRTHNLVDSTEHSQLSGTWVGQAFREAGRQDAYDAFEGGRGQRRVPPALPNAEYLKRDLAFLIP